ncbi:hypothetical protein [Asanoa siamensis]|uniref:Uncharacterized protein n=1 Tax=Asanoa siamensis TaxID=926357 RepID=A0ABQ4CIV3_9ACTN|nr:hypothetical protein [Asanoa siamensis]GIF71214.1 hypothetical protein Asi02nite_07320 [Asanoa siamensis]
MLDLLAVRLAELRDDVDKVKRVADLAESRHSRLDGLRGVRKDVWDGLLEARRMILEIRGDAPELERLGDLDDLLIDLDRKMSRAGVMLDQLDGSMIRLMNTDTMSARCGAMLDEIDKLEGALRAGTLDRPAAWAAVDELTDTTGRRLFADYVDLLGGLTLRDTGLDDRVSELTDRLLDELTVPLRAVPARPADLTGDHALGDLVMLWFPEWTIWDVPLFGHEAGLAWCRTSPLAGNLLGDDPPARRRTLAADAYAAYALGPAYACAVLLLRMRADSSDVDRAYVILAVLRSMAVDGMAAAVVDLVEQCWQGAISERGGDPAPARRAELDAFASTAYATLRDISSFRGFDAIQWDAEAAEPYAALDRSQERGSGGASVRGLLNAAWAARLTLADPHDAHALREVADAARALLGPRKAMLPRERHAGRPAQARPSSRTGDYRLPYQGR